MCGIIGYVGSQPALPLLVEALRRMEYRGYDSAGVLVLDGGKFQLERAVGKLGNLESKLTPSEWRGNCGMGHTRWATHGEPLERNAHPLAGPHRRVFVIHNGIIENHDQIRQFLCEKGYEFRSDTDTEVLAYLIEDLYDGSLAEAVQRALARVVGAYGLVVMSRDEAGTLVAARRGSPLILGLGDGEHFAASDIAALISHTRDVVYLEDDDVAEVGAEGVRIHNLQEAGIQRPRQEVDWDLESAEKQGFAHFMLKEIHEQPQALENAMRGRTVRAEGIAKLGGLESVEQQLRNMDHLVIVSCGTSYHAGLLGRYIIETCTDLPVEVELASEFRYRKLNLRPNTVVLAISQSGETADTLAAIREARRKGALTLGLVNVVGSTIARETVAGVYNHAGPEIGVASTKSFLSQLTVLYLIALLLGRWQSLSLAEGRAFIREMQLMPDKINDILSRSDSIEDIARRYASFGNFLFLGRKFNYPIALEGALKLKEISYLHAEGYAAGEMKHGPLALVDETFPSVCIAPTDAVHQKMLSNIQEVKARRGPIVGIGTVGDGQLAGLSDDIIEIPACGDLFTPLLTVVALQLLAYYVALEKGCEIDQPRNLAKSVTVE